MFTVKLDNGKKVLSLGIILQYSTSHYSGKISTAVYLNWFLRTTGRKTERLLIFDVINKKLQ